MRLHALLLVAVALPAAAAPATVAQAPAATPAQTTTTPPATTPPTSAPSGDQAREHYERGLAKYNLAEFDAAIVEFKASYELSHAPRLLFNIAQAYRLKKDYDSALYFYNTYLRADPNPPNLDDVDAKIDEMKRALDEKHKAAAAAEQQRHEQQQQHETPPPVVDRRPSKRTLKIAGLTVAGLGIAACGVGGGMLGLAQSDSNALHRVATNGMPWTTANQSTYDQGELAQTTGIVLLSAGGALVVAGAVTLFVATRRP